jgi:hypothetical protein
MYQSFNASSMVAVVQTDRREMAEKEYIRPWKRSVRNHWCLVVKRAPCPERGKHAVKAVWMSEVDKSEGGKGGEESRRQEPNVSGIFVKFFLKRSKQI